MILQYQLYCYCNILKISVAYKQLIRDLARSYLLSLCFSFCGSFDMKCVAKKRWERGRQERIRRKGIGREEVR